MSTDDKIIRAAAEVLARKAGDLFPGDWLGEASAVVAAVRPLIEVDLIERGPVERTVCWTCRGTGLVQATGDDCTRCGGRGRLAVVVLGGVR